MMDFNLAASGNASIQASNVCQLTRNHTALRAAKRMLVSLDRRAQRFFNTQATVRGRQTAQTQWGVQPHEGFF